jgi:hypothetical protein
VKIISIQKAENDCRKQRRQKNGGKQGIELTTNGLELSAINHQEIETNEKNGEKMFIQQMNTRIYIYICSLDVFTSRLC